MSNTKFLQKKHILAIDDLADFRAAIKRMVETFGAINIDVALSGEDALEQMARKNYDIILCDYNLGEEAKFKGILRNDQIFIIITGESTTEMVMGALEYEPDGYLIKPFNHEMLFTRLERIMGIKQELKDIYKALEHKEYEKVINLAEQKISEGKLVPNCIKIKANMLMKLEKFDMARELFNSLLQKERPAWVLLGLGKVHFFEKNYTDAAQVFQEIIKIGPNFVEAYDWLAKSKIELGQIYEAQRILEKAVKISPKAILRQQVLAEVALKNADGETAERALRTAVGLGKNSVYRKQEDYFNLADTLLNKATDTGGGLSSKRASDEAINILEGVSHIYEDDKDIQAKSAVYQGRAMVTQGRPDKAKNMLERAEEIMKNHFVKLDPKDMLNLAKTHVELGNKKKGEALIKKVLAETIGDETVSKQAEDIAEALDLVVSEKSLNRQGIRLFESGQLKEAAELFDKAVIEMPNNYSALLNAAQANMQYMKKEGAQKSMLDKVRKMLDAVKDMPESDKRYDRYQQLLKIFQEIS